MSHDPFAIEDMDEIVSDFASLDSFRGRLILITPTDFDPLNKNDEGRLQPKYTATITTVDGKGRVQQYANKTAVEGAYLAGPRHEGVWLSQERVVKRLKTAWEKKSSILGVPQTYKPGRPAGKGNPWDINPATDAQKQSAREFLASMTVDVASENDATEENPFNKSK